MQELPKLPTFYNSIKPATHKKREIREQEIFYLPYNPQRQLGNFTEKPRTINQEKKKEKFYRDWTLYNQYQAKEKLLSYKIIHAIIENEPIIKTYSGIGRPPLDIKDKLKALAMKIFTNFSYRRLESELYLVKGLGYLQNIPKRTTTNELMENQQITPLLQNMITKIAKPLIPHEKYFAADATGFSAPNKRQWSKIRLDKKEHKDYKKLHIMIGIQTHIITSAIVTEGTSADTLQYKHLLRQTGKFFSIKEVSADAGYLSRFNVEITSKHGATPYIMPKKNVKSKARGHYPTWQKMITLWKTNEAKFRAHYHRRSNVESTFGQIKAKFSGNIKSKTYNAQVNEILFKVLCHNISTLVRAVFEAKIDLDSLI